LDLPGFGLSLPSAEHDHDFIGTAIAMHTALSKAGFTAAGVILHASCLPGLYALAFAKAYPEVTKGLLLAQTPSPEHLKLWAKRVIPGPLKVPFLGQCAMFCLRRGFAEKWFRIAAARSDPHRKTRSVRWASEAHAVLDDGGCFCLASAVQGTMYAEHAWLADVSASIPVVCMWGSGDRSHAKTPADSLSQFIPHARVHDMGTSVGHFPSMECQDEFLSELLLMVQ
jgi:pimeloyl-ACP methyl ester carboxylesterase